MRDSNSRLRAIHTLLGFIWEGYGSFLNCVGRS